MQKKNSREAAYLAVLEATQNINFIESSLDQWIIQHQPCFKDIRFAQEISYGTLRMRFALDHFVFELNGQKKPKMKVKERVLLHTALYQHFFMDRVPLYAIVNETIEIAKKHLHKSFISFLNFLLRKLENFSLELPKGDSLEELSITYSYPLYYIHALFEDYGMEKAKELLKMGNKPGKTMARMRSKDKTKRDGLQIIKEGVLPVAVVEDSLKISQIATSSDYYIQNVTPVELIEKLVEKLPSSPKTILDLCASPGGKLIALHDLYPNAELFANDVSEEKLVLLRSNLKKYNINATLYCSEGHALKVEKPFDLIVVDAPCSNTGVLNKRPEARFRLDKVQLQKLEQLQKSLLKNALKTLSSKGFIFYMTCSILKKENEILVRDFCQETGASFHHPITHLMDNMGRDGGFGCIIQKT